MKLRVFPGIMIILSLMLIFSFTSQDAEHSAALSEKVAVTVARVVYDNFDVMPTHQRESLLFSIQHPVRKLAHMTEFAFLALWLTVFFMTFNIKASRAVLLVLAFALVAAASDEFHQMFVNGRAPLMTDVLIDLIGAAIGMLFTLGIRKIFKRKWGTRDEVIDEAS